MIVIKKIKNYMNYLCDYVDSKKYNKYLFFCFIFYNIGGVLLGVDTHFEKQNNDIKKRPLNILIVVPIFPKLSETFVLNQIAGLLDRGHNVWIHAKVRGNTKCMHQLVFDYDLLARTYYNKWPSNMAHIDIAICQLGGWGAEFVRKKKSIDFKGKVITCFRGVDISAAIKSCPNRYNDLFKQGDLFLPVCDYFKQRLICLGCNANKIVVHHSAINCSCFAYKERTPNKDGIIRLLTIGRLAEKKGIEYAIRAVAQVTQQHPNIQYTIVGTDVFYRKKSEKQRLKQLVKKLNMQRHIRLLDGCTQQETIQHLDNTHIFLLPSVTASNGDQEGIPNVLKEAMACGIPVISTRHSGIPELIGDGISGLLTAEKDIQGLSDNIIYMIEHPETWPAMGQAGRKKVEQEFEMEHISDELEKMLYQLVSNIVFN